MSLDDIRIVLVEPSHPGNIGAVARAMKTMALSDLALVRPVEFPSPHAERRSMGAKDLLEKARVFDSLEEAVGDCRLVIGSSARSRSFPHSIMEPRECAAQLISESADGEPTALVFGPERTGLANRELDQCTYQVRIPANEAFSSLNLGAAVQLLCYELFMASRTPAEAAAARPQEKPSLQIEMEHFFDHLERALDSRGYLEGEMREVTLAKLRRFFNRGRPHSGELKLLHTMLKMMHKDGE